MGCGTSKSSSEVTLHRRTGEDQNSKVSPYSTSTEGEIESGSVDPYSCTMDMDIAVEKLQNVLKEKYNFTGTLLDTVFSSNSADAFQQLTDKLIVSSEKNVSVPTTGGNSPQIGDIAFVYWDGCGWFTATIKDWLPSELTYMIKWTDGNWAPEKAKYTNLCVDKVPDASTIGVGSKVLFQQGLYYCGHNDDGTVCDSTGRTLSEEKKKEIGDKGQISDRWHMGVLTKVYKNHRGEDMYDGRHVVLSDPQASKNDYVGYSTTFQELRIDQLRTLPNIYNCIDSSTDDTANAEDDSCDVFVSKVSLDDDSVHRIANHIKSSYNVSQSKSKRSADLQRTVGQIKNCKVYMVCLSDNFIQDQEAMSELLYAKKTLGKTVIPLVMGSSQKWAHTTAGMLLAGQLYIQFASEDAYHEKISELESNLGKFISAPSFDPSSKIGAPPRVFISYCWSNSKGAMEAGQIRSLSGHEYSDPRKIKKDIEDRLGERVWLDIEQLDSVDDSGMFGQIAKGLSACSVVVMCISKEYANSLNCQMEANFALRSLRKDVVVVEVGSGSMDDRTAWVRSSIGMVLPHDAEGVVMTEDECNDEDAYKTKMETICEKVMVNLEPTDEDEEYTDKESIKKEETEMDSLRDTVPMIGDSVVAHYAAWQFFPAKVAEFDKTTLKYTVDWDDPDPSCRVQPYTLVAVNRAPNESEAGLGTSVLFKQGTYRYGDSTGDVWNLGEITDIEEIDGEKLYSGKHSKTAEDGLAVAGWSTFSPTFHQHKCEDLRLFPNAMEMLQAYKNL